MGYKSDIQATRGTATGSVVAPAVRLRGISISNNTASVGSLTLTNGNGVTTLLVLDVAAGDVLTLSIPEDGIPFGAGIYCSVFTSLTGFTVFTDKYSAPGLTSSN